MTDAANGFNELAAGTCQSLASGKKYVTSRGAAETLGVPESVVVHDIEEGMDGALPALIGGRFADYWLVAQWQLEGEHLERHKKRLSSWATVTVNSDPA